MLIYSILLFTELSSQGLDKSVFFVPVFLK